jgi:RNA polymerase sigma factor (sigma-70 family)
VDLTQEKIDLIEKVIRNNRKFSGNADLYEDFFNETYKRSLSIVGAVNSDALEPYLRKVAATSIISVLKDSGRLRRTRQGFVPTPEEPLETVETRPEHVFTAYRDVTPEITPEDTAVQNELFQKVNDILNKINAENPDKNYLELFNMRYASAMTQKEIAEVLKLSQSEVSKRLFALMNKVKEEINRDYEVSEM